MSKRVKLDISEISDELYDAVLKELWGRFGASATFSNWEISADIDEDNTLTCPRCGYTLFGNEPAIEVVCTRCERGLTK